MKDARALALQMHRGEESDADGACLAVISKNLNTPMTIEGVVHERSEG